LRGSSYCYSRLIACWYYTWYCICGVKHVECSGILLLLLMFGMVFGCDIVNIGSVVYFIQVLVHADKGAQSFYVATVVLFTVLSLFSFVCTLWFFYVMCYVRFHDINVPRREVYIQVV
jgi:uncharacterized membrane protein YhaH (DUF805 family)